MEWLYHANPTSNQQHSFLWKEINGTRIIGKKSTMITFVPDMMKRLIKWINVFTLCKSNTVKFYQHASTVWYVIHKSQLFFVKKDFKRVRRKNFYFLKSEFLSQQNSMTSWQSNVYIFLHLENHVRRIYFQKLCT